MTITTHEYSALERAYEFFNERLFQNQLPPCLMTLNTKHPQARGFFRSEGFQHRQNDRKIDEIALNPETFNRPDLAILSTLVHEQCHVWQFHLGKPSRSGYHNKEWSAAMEQVGLTPSDTGLPGGKKTGQRMTHYVAAGGPFQIAAQELLASGFALSWQSPSFGAQREKKQTRTKYSCGSCGLSAWAKPDAHLVCGNCALTLKPQN